jgi:hypothetical protein
VRHEVLAPPMLLTTLTCPERTGDGRPPILGTEKNYYRLSDEEAGGY